MQFTEGMRIYALAIEKFNLPIGAPDGWARVNDDWIRLLG